MNKALLWIGALLLAALSALFTVPRVVDWNSYRGVFEEEASRMLGRQVRVGGDVAVRLLPSPYVRFEQLRIADTTGTLGEPFFRADSFTMGLSITPLLRGAIEATRIVVAKPVLTLALDAQGRGNWRDFKMSVGALPFVPADVSLQSVSIEDGVVGVRVADGAELVRLEAVSGEFSADSLDGPYKFRGTTRWDGKPREVTLSTAKPDADGGLRFKALVRTGEGGARYTVEATALDLATRPRISGELAAKLPFRTVDAATGAAKTASGERGIDLKSKLYADTAGASLSDLTLSFDQGDQPQLVAGEALASWLAGTRIKVKLSSLWLDLDRLASGEPGHGSGGGQDSAKPVAAGAPSSIDPLRAVRLLVPQLVAVLPRTASTELAVTVEQVNLGGEVASNVGLSLVRGEGPMQLRALKAALPGGTQIDLSGELTLADAGEAFTGTVALNGTSVSRFLGWVLQRPSGIEQRSDGAFSLQGRIAIDSRSFDLADATSEVFGTPLSGALNYRWDGRRAARLLLEGPRIDMAALLPGVLDRLAVMEMLRPGAGGASKRDGAAQTSGASKDGDPRVGTGKEAPASRGWVGDLGETDVALRVRAGEVTDGRDVLRDVDADASLVDGKLTLRQVALTTSEGLRVEVEGELANLHDAPQGTLRGMIAATNARALGGFVDALGVPRAEATGEVRDRRLQGLVPLRLAGALTLGARGEAAVLTLDGAVRGGRTRTTLRMDGGLAGWRTAPVDLALTLDDAGTGLALAEVLFGRSQRLAAIDASAVGKGEVVIRAKGTPIKSLLALASVRTPSLDFDYDGTARLPERGGVEVGGTARISAERAAPVLALVGLARSAGLAEAAIDGHVTFMARGSTLEIRPRGLSVAGTPIDGVVRLAEAAGGRQSLDADLTVASAGVTGLLAGLLEAGAETGGVQTGAVPAAIAIEQARQMWPDKPFSLAAVDRLEGRIRLAVGTLTLANGLAVRNAVLTAKVAPGRIVVEQIAGRASGGAFTANVTLEKAAAGATVSGRIGLEDARLETLAGADAASGSGSFTVSFSGRALSPRALLSVATGSGEARLVKASVKHLSPTAVDRTAEAVLAGEVEPTADAVRATLQRLLPSQGLALGSRRVPIAIVDGAARIGRLAFDTGEAKGSIETTIDLATLMVDSNWTLGSKAVVPATDTKPAKPPLPAISLVYVGALGSIGAMEPRLNIDALEREITVRKMERDVEELERLRRLDEEAARAEAERVRLLEEARIAAERRAAEDAARAAAQVSGQGPNLAPAIVPPAPVPARPPGALPRSALPAAPATGEGVAVPQTSTGTPGSGVGTGLTQVVPASGPPPEVPPDAAAANGEATATDRRPPRVTRKSNPPAPSPFRPFDRSYIPN